MAMTSLSVASDANEADQAHDQWLLAVASVLFDIDKGQTIESLYPDNALTTEEQKAVAFHSFPDSMSMELHSRSSIRDSTFFFRVVREGTLNGQEASMSQSSAQAKTVSHQHYHSQRQDFIYGFVFCRQRQDDTLKRGGEQKSLVLLSLQPYSHVLSQLRQWAGPLYFNYGANAIQEIFEEVSEWDAPVPSSRRMLHAGNMTIFAEVPHQMAMPPPWAPDNFEELADLELQAAIPPLDTMQGCFGEVDVYTPFKAMLDKLHAIWEVAVLAQPLLVVAPSPGECSAGVAAILALLAPLPYSADFRPYYTIHDPSFNDLLSQQLPNNVNGLPRLLGVTNLYFLKALPQWPNVVSLGTKPQQPSSSPNGGDSSQSRLTKAVQRKSAGAKSLLATYTEAAWLNHKPLTRPNKQLLERLLKFQGGDGPERLTSIASTNSTALKKHFNQLIVAMLQPFEACIQAKPPPPGNTPLPTEIPETHHRFSHSEFLKGLEKPDAIPPLMLECFSSKAKCIQFYQHFLEIPNFATWFERRRGRAALWQECAWRQAELERGRDFETEGVPEVHLVDLFAALECKLAESEHGEDSKVKVRRVMLTKQLRKVYSQMPRDLQACMLSNPTRAALLQSHSSNSRLAPGHLKVSHS